jgi:cell cycle arrest protein BUB3
MMTTLAAHPGQSVSTMTFSPTNSDLLMVGSWDSTVRIFDVVRNANRGTFTFDAPILDVCYDTHGQHAFAAGLDKHAYIISTSGSTANKRRLGQASKAVSCLAFSNHGSLFTGSWDGAVYQYDPKQQQAQQARLDLGEGQIYSMDTAGSTLVVATASKKLLLFDVRYMSAPMESRDSPLKSQLRTVRMRPDGSSFVCSSIEGRIGIEFVNSASEEVKKKNYTFKCHRKGDMICPVNTVAFHPCGTFASGGSDGTVAVWDGDRRKRQLALPAFPLPIAALAFNNTGTHLAIAASQTFEDSNPGDPMLNNIYIRSMKDSEVLRGGAR